MLSPRLLSALEQRMTENATPETNTTPPPRRIVGKPFAKGTSGNPSGRPKVESRVRRIARRYDRRMVRVLASIAEDPKVPPSERRRAAVDLVSIGGTGRMGLVQEVLNAQPPAPLVSLNFNQQGGAPLDPASAYRMMVEGTLEPDPAVFQRPAIEGTSTTGEASHP